MNRKMMHVNHNGSFRVELFYEFISQVAVAVANEGKYRISQSIFISRISDNCLYYTGSNWQSEYKITFNDLENIILNGGYNKDQIRMMHLPAMAKLHAGYYSSIVYDFLNFSEIARAFSRAERRFAA